MRTVTGSTNNPVQDGATRGVIAGALTALLVFVSDKVDWLSDGDVATLTPFIVGVAFLLGGLFDRLAKPRLNSG